jgi:hypothetical protein
MPSNNETIVKEGINGDGEFEIILDDSEKGRHRIIMPLFYDFILFPVEEKTNSIAVSSMKISDIRTVINVPGNTPRLKLKVMKPASRSNTDPTGSTGTAGDDEEGDRFGESAVKFVDWLKTQNDNMDEKTGEFVRFVQNARREIIIQKEKT